MRALPAEIRVNSERLSHLLRHLERELGLKIKLTRHLRKLQQTRAELLGFMGR
ncbi:MAG: hypothetical protein HXY40_12690 [Chloroflexi bacterium]|nr:hypothetical protein [Chloroflexota bacterium]